MSAGFQIIGDYGQTQVDETLVNFALITSGSLSMAARTFTDVVYNGTNPIIFVSGTSDKIHLYRVNSSGSTFTFTFLSGNAASFNYYIFDSISNISAASGLTVYNAAGTVVFSSDVPVLKIALMTTGPSGQINLASNDLTVTMPAGRTYAAIVTSPRNAWYPNGTTYPSSHLVDAILVSGNTITVSGTLVQTGPPGVSSIGNTAGILLVADITGY